MTRRFVVVLILVLASACERATETPGSGSVAAPQPSGVEGGFCREHGVLEAVCTKCNPALIAVFKAKGDWCEQHGFAESFCPVCHPEKAGRPDREVKDDEAPPDGTKVSFRTKDTARLAGIEVAKVEQRARSTELSVTAKIVYDATKVAEVNARSAGVVRAIRADVGARVRSGAPLAVIESSAVGAEQSRLQTARARLQLAETSYGRMSQLSAEGIAPEKDLLAARQELDAARADVFSAQAALGMVGGTTDGASRYTLTAPLSGVVTQRNATIGRMVNTELVLFEIVDTSSMWGELDIPETELPRVVSGQRVTLSVEGLDGRQYSGTLSYVAPQIDVHTRTAMGRVALDNPDGLLRGNMFARARLAVTDLGSTLVVPREALQRAKTAHLVFVKTAADVFEARRVQPGAGDDRFVEVSGRLQAGDEVATQGSFLLKTETLKGNIGAGCCDVEPPK